VRTLLSATLRVFSVACLVSWGGLAHAADGTILRIEGPDLYVDIGVATGLRAGDSVALYRIVSLRDPTSGKTLSDRFAVGDGQVVEAGAGLSRLRAAADVVARLQVGDVAVSVDRPIAAQGPAAPAAVGASRVVVAKASADSAHLGELAAAMDLAAAEADPAGRARVWEAFLRLHPDHPAAGAVQRELQALDSRAAADASQRARIAEIDAATASLGLNAKVVAPSRSPAGEPIDVVVVYGDARTPAAALLFRAIGEGLNVGDAEPGSFTSVPMVERGSGSLYAQVPVSATAGTAVEWFVLLGGSGGPQVLGGDVDKPSRTELVGNLPPPPVAERSQVRLAAELVDFYQLEGVDQYTSLQGEFLYRVDRGALYAVGVGMGFLDGVSADTQALDAAPSAAARAELTEDVGYKYGDVQVEMRFTRRFSTILRGVAGVERDGLAAGAAAHFRLGDEEGTYLRVGATTIGSVGQVYLLDLSWDTVPRLPMRAGVEVTNQPGVAAEDFGVRLLTEVRYELTEQVQLGGRLGYQLRNIQHSGPSFGGVLVFGW
jgi:hypothetical protein